MTRRYLKLLAKWMLYFIGMGILMLTALMVVSAAQAVTSDRVTLSDKTAYRMCAEIGGPNVWFYFNDNGKLVCTNKRGNRLRTQP